jgi:hypothetical protein
VIQEFKSRSTTVLNTPSIYWILFQELASTGGSNEQHLFGLVILDQIPMPWIRWVGEAALHM